MRRIVANSTLRSDRDRSAPRLNGVFVGSHPRLSGVEFKSRNFNHGLARERRFRPIQLVYASNPLDGFVSSPSTPRIGEQDRDLGRAEGDSGLASCLRLVSRGEFSRSRTGGSPCGASQSPSRRGRGTRRSASPSKRPTARPTGVDQRPSVSAAPRTSEERRVDVWMARISS